jgi:tetratricopeptide (TPR) repeat protein
VAYHGLVKDGGLNLKRWILVLLIWAGGFWAEVDGREFLNEIEEQYNQGKLKEALAVAQAFAQTHPDSVDAQGFLGTLSAEMGQWEVAESALKRLIALKPSSARGYRDLAVVYAQQGMIQQAMGVFEDGIGKSDQPEVLLTERSSLNLDLGNADQAVSDLENAIVRAPTFVDAYQQMSLLHIGLKDTSKAVGVMARALKANPNNVVLKVNQGGIFHALGLTQSALAAYREAIEWAPEDPAAYRALGFMASEAGSLKVALAAWERARTLAPGDLEVRDALSQLYLRQRDGPAAVTEMKAILDMAPNASRIRLRLAEVYAQTGQLPDAKAQLLDCIARSDQWLPPYKRLALIYMSEDLVDSTEMIYNKALNLVPDDPEIHNNLGYVYSMRGELEKAKAAYRKAMDGSKDAATLRDAQNNLEIIGSIQAGKMRARHLLVKTEIEAQEILGQLKSGANFVEMIKKYSIDPSKAMGGNIGFFSKGDLHPAFEEAVLKLKPNDISGVVKTPMGFHIIQRIN